MKRDTTLLIRFTSCHFSSSQTTGDHNFNSFGSHTHCRSDRHLYSTTVRNFALKLTCNIVSYYVSIKFRTFNFKDIYLNFLLGDLLEFFLKLVNFLSAFTYNDTRTCSIYSYGNKLECSFNNNL